MANYYFYRVNTNYDGLLPSELPRRISNKRFVYNWRTYIESLEKGDIVLTYFTGGGCKKGIYLITYVTDIDVIKKRLNVTTKALVYSSVNEEPIIDVARNSEYFSSVSGSRRRGAEIVVPDSMEGETYNLLKTIPDFLTDPKIRNIQLPGAIPRTIQSVIEVPRINLLNDISEPLQRKNIISAFWIRPRQSSGIKSAPSWLGMITSFFSKFKVGNLDHVDDYAVTICEQILKKYKNPKRYFYAVISTPLNSEKRKSGEVDRVAELAKIISKKLDIKYEKVFSLSGGISRRLYKRKGYSTDKFINDYQKNLKITKPFVFRKSLELKKGILLLDDVYTDGITTRSIINKCLSELKCGDLNVVVVTLGIMAKKRNMNKNLYEKWV